MSKVKRLGIGFMFLQIIASSLMLAFPNLVYAQTLAEYGVANKDRVEDAVEYAEWLDAAHIKVHFKNGKELSFMPGGVKDNGISSLQDERESYETGYGVSYNKVTPSYGCDAAVRVDINENKTDFEKQKTVLDPVNIDIDFKPNADSDCVDGNEFDINPRNPQKSIAYFVWSAPNQITTSDGEAPKSFTKGTTTATIDGVQYDVYLRDAESNASSCKDKLILDKTNNKVKWYELDSKYTGNPPDDISTTCDYNESAFPRNNEWWDIANTAETVKDVPLSTGELAQLNEEEPSCEGSIDNGFGWIICPALSLIDKFIDASESFIAGKLEVTQDAIEGQGEADVRDIWQSIARFSSGLLVLVALVMVVSTALGFDFVSAYTVKKVLPRIVIGAIGIWLSWTLVTNYVLFMNALGKGIASIMYSAVPEAKDLGLRGIVAIVAEDSGVGTDLATGIFTGLSIFGAAASAGIFGLLLGALTVVAAIAVAVIVLAARSVMILMAVILAPIAIVSWILPNTNKLWKFWSSNLNKLLFMFPMIMALFAGAKIMAYISATTATESSGFLEMMFPIIIYALPLFVLPKLFKSAGGILSSVTAATNKLSQGVTRGARDNLTARKKELKDIKAADRRARADERYAAGAQTMRDRLAYGKGFAIRRNNREALSKASDQRIEKGLQSATEREKYAKEQQSLRDRLINGKAPVQDSIAVSVARSNAAAERTRLDRNMEVPVLDSNGRQVMRPVTRTVRDADGNERQEPVTRPVMVRDATGNMVPDFNPDGTPRMEQVMEPVTRRTGISIAEKEAQIKMEQAAGRAQIEDATLELRRSTFDPDAEVAKVKKAERQSAVEAVKAKLLQDSVKGSKMRGPASGLIELIRNIDPDDPGSEIELDVYMQSLLEKGADSEIRELMFGKVDEGTGAIIEPPVSGKQYERLRALIDGDSWYVSLKDKAPDLAKIKLDVVDSAGAVTPFTLNPETSEIVSPAIASSFGPGAWYSTLNALSQDPAKISMIDDYVNMIKTRPEFGSTMDTKKLKEINKVLVATGRPELTMADVYTPPAR